MIDGKAPTRESMLLATRLSCHSFGSLEEMTASAKAAQQLINDMLQVPQFVAIAKSLHGVLDHTPVYQNCEDREMVLLSAFSQFFAFGYAAARQEIMDEQIAHLEKQL